MLHMLPRCVLLLFVLVISALWTALLLAARSPRSPTAPPPSESLKHLGGRLIGCCAPWHFIPTTAFDSLLTRTRWSRPFRAAGRYCSVATTTIATAIATTTAVAAVAAAVAVTTAALAFAATSLSANAVAVAATATSLSTTAVAVAAIATATSITGSLATTSIVASTPITRRSRRRRRRRRWRPQVAGQGALERRPPQRRRSRITRWSSS